MDSQDKILGIGTYEKKIYLLLKACLSEGESLEIHPQFDFYAPQGIKKINLKAKTAIEVKFRLIYDTLSKIKYSFPSGKIIVLTFSSIISPIFLKN